MNEGNLTVIRDHTLPTETNPITSAAWNYRLAGKHKYVDDGIIDLKINTETMDITEKDGRKIKDKHAVDCQNMFKRVVHNAESIGMK